MAPFGRLLPVSAAYALPLSLSRVYHLGMTKITAIVSKFEKSKIGAQVFRLVRIVVPGLVVLAVSHNGVAAVSVAGVVEAAFRQVFPSQAAAIAAAVEAPKAA